MLIDKKGEYSNYLEDDVKHSKYKEDKKKENKKEKQKDTPRTK